MPRRKPTEIARPDSLGGIFAARNGIAAYQREYEKGWRCTNFEDGPFQTGTGSDAFEDGYLDQAAGREKWHLARCPNHDNTPDGCGVA